MPFLLLAPWACDGGSGGDDDACGGCPSNSNQSLSCTDSGLCKCSASCTPACDGKACGDDGCGGICGEPCADGSVCTFGSGSWACAPFAGADATMSFFVTSQGNGDAAGNFGGLAGADAFCQQLAQAVGAGGKTWRAYLSAGSEAARDRIGSGPWYNAAGAAIVDPTCSDCVADLHAGGIATELAITELGTQIDWANAHDILTGSDQAGNPTGLDCNGWTSNAEGDRCTVGHANESFAWNSAHDTGCDRVGMQCTAGQSHLYCFASD